MNKNLVLKWNLIVAGLFLVLTSACEKEDSLDKNVGYVKIESRATTTVYEVILQEVEFRDDGQWWYVTDDLADDDYLPIGTDITYEVKPGIYYVLVRSMGGFWYTNSDNYITVEKGDRWTVRYTYTGGYISKESS